jgi:hypothetical protein
MTAIMVMVAAPRIRLAVHSIVWRSNNMRGTAAHRRKMINARAANSATRDTAIADAPDTQAADVTNTTEATDVAATTQAADVTNTTEAADVAATTQAADVAATTQAADVAATTQAADMAATAQAATAKAAAHVAATATAAMRCRYGRRDSAGPERHCSKYRDHRFTHFNFLRCARRQPTSFTTDGEGTRDRTDGVTVMRRDDTAITNRSYWPQDQPDIRASRGSSRFAPPSLRRPQ